MKTLEKQLEYLHSENNKHISPKFEYNSTENINQIKQDYLNLIRCSYPFCKCGKCISKNTKEKEILPNLHYGNINSTYNNQYIWKATEKNFLQNEKEYQKIIGNKSRLDECFKHHLKSGLVSVMKNDYVAMQTEPNHQIIQKNNIEISRESPFIGRSNYSIMFPGWSISKNKNENKEFNSEKKTNIAFNAKSSYQHNYERFDDRYYSNDRVAPILKKDNLEVNGKLITETTSKETYKAHDFTNQSNITLKSNVKKNDCSANFMNLIFPTSKNSFLSSYERAFMLNNLSSSGISNNTNILTSLEKNNMVLRSNINKTRANQIENEQNIDNNKNVFFIT